MFRAVGILLVAALLWGQAFRFAYVDGEFRLVGWTGGPLPPAAGWESVFPVFAGKGRTPMLGTYAVEGDTLVFRPRFPAAPGIEYHGNYPGGGFDINPGLPTPAQTRVEHIYPSTSVLPANTLKLYLVFSSPMSMGEAWQHLHLLDERGHPVQDAFLDQELWDPDHVRLTILFDPGRIKRGLRLSKEAGTPIIPGSRYTLSIDATWQDAQGIPLQGGFQKMFVGGPAERTPADPHTWRLTAPAPGTSEPLVIDFTRPMDFALLQRMLSVPGVSGQIVIARKETEWRFTPDSAWKPGAYSVVVDSTLEDVSGNHLDRPFDVDLRSKSLPPRQVVLSALPDTLSRI